MAERPRDAADLAGRFVFGAGNVDVDRHCHFGMEVERHRMEAHGLDRVALAVEGDQAARFADVAVVGVGHLAGTVHDAVMDDGERADIGPRPGDFQIVDASLVGSGVH